MFSPFWVPILAAVLSVVLGAPKVTGPLILVSLGVTWFVLVMLTTLSAIRRLGPEAGFPRDQAITRLDSEELKSAWPEHVFLPSLVTASWSLQLAGLIWLAVIGRFVLAIVVLAAIVGAWSLYIVYRKWRPMPDVAPTGADDPHDAPT